MSGEETAVQCLQLVKIRCLCTIKGVTQSDRFQNEGIRPVVKVCDVADKNPGSDTSLVQTHTEDE